MIVDKLGHELKADVLGSLDTGRYALNRGSALSGRLYGTLGIAETML